MCGQMEDGRHCDRRINLRCKNGYVLMKKLLTKILFVYVFLLEGIGNTF
jgi:hypothetical protein